MPLRAPFPRRLGALLFALVLLASAHAQSTTDTGSGTSGSGVGSGTTSSGTTSSGATASYDSPNSYDLGGGTVSLASAILNGGTVTNGTLDVSDSIVAYRGSISAQLTGTAYLTKNSTGTLTLSGINTYAGNTNITVGTVVLNGSIAGTKTTVYSLATLGGSGTINSPTTVWPEGIIAPGNSPGTLTFTDGLTLDADSILSFELGTSSDLIAITGGTFTAPSSGTVTVDVADSGGFTAGTYTLIDYTGAAALDVDASDFTLGTAPSGWDYSFNLTGTALQLVVTTAAVPDPASAALATGLAALGTVVWQRRRRPARA